MLISKRELPVKTADSEFMQNLLKKMEGAGTPGPSPVVNPVADAEEKSEDSIPSNEFLGQQRKIKSRYASLGEEYVSDEILSLLTPENIQSYVALMELISATKQAIKYYSKEIESSDLEAASLERAGNAEQASKVKASAQAMHAKLQKSQDTMSNVPAMVEKWKTTTHTV